MCRQGQVKCIHFLTISACFTHILILIAINARNMSTITFHYHIFIFQYAMISFLSHSLSLEGACTIVFWIIQWMWIEPKLSGERERERDRGWIRLHFDMFIIHLFTNWLELYYCLALLLLFFWLLKAFIC